MSQTNESSKNETPKQEEKAGEVHQEVGPPATDAGEQLGKTQGVFRKSLGYLVALIVQNLKRL
jgi:hypothetical protein